MTVSQEEVQRAVDALSNEIAALADMIGAQGGLIALIGRALNDISPDVAEHLAQAIEASGFSDRDGATAQLLVQTLRHRPPDPGAPDRGPWPEYLRPVPKTDEPTED